MAVNTLKTFSNNIGSHIKGAGDHIYTEASHLGHNLKDTVTFHHRDFDQDDELIKNYKHDIKQAKSGLDHLISQNNQFFKKIIPHVMSLNMKIVYEFQNLIGPNSLQFKNIEKYYHEYDVYEAESEIPHIHPKERLFLIDSVNDELFQYMQSIGSLKFYLDNECADYISTVIPKFKSMKKRLNETLKLIKKRDRKREDQDRLDRKIAKLNQKQNPLSEKDQKELDKLQKQFNEVDKSYHAINEKTITILPHLMSFLDEFIEVITKLLICKQTSIYKRIRDTLQYFTRFYGLINETIPEYDSIISHWEQDATKTRLQIESFLTIVQNKNPELINEEIDDKDKSSTTHKLYLKIANKAIDKKHIVKPKNLSQGMFNDIEESDSIKSFQKYNNPHANESETYHPRKLIDPIEITSVTDKPIPPALPPRTSTMSLMPTKPIHEYQPIPLYSQSAANSMESLSLDDDDTSVMSDSSSVSSLSSHSMAHYNNEKINSSDRSLKKLYNLAKNEIKISPQPIKQFSNYPIVGETSQLNQIINTSYKIALLEHLFNKVGKLNKTPKLAKFDFQGIEIGDLSFNEGDKIDVLYDLQNIDYLYQQNNLNWVVGLIKDEESYRIGFVPSNYLA
ncbi:uncharacterized protein KGF55_001484 [Candida pseudojiufengensis]|uniref:uncharacterized protein n=1 Tax=Candida pseudojiufengensis TaxID=497109 RepID=UPI0022241266|nr:uncharacterized protein KGF55_001484 [Candida pseudojiufengensis]KAI5965264.1 hypothetical protein KGF55_001484 [Candida pseudojiufengensis]